MNDLLDRIKNKGGEDFGNYFYTEKELIEIIAMVLAECRAAVESQRRERPREDSYHFNFWCGHDEGIDDAIKAIDEV